MTQQEILDKAIYIQYPTTRNTYHRYNGIKNINKLPFPEKGELYNGWSYNSHHFTTEYQRKYVYPLLTKLLGLNYDPSKHYIEKRNANGYDISMIRPKSEPRYEVYNFTSNEHFADLSYSEITTGTTNNTRPTEYHNLYICGHECSRLINKSIDNNKKLFISGDSQFIPVIPFLSLFYKEIWYFDNRKRNKLHQLYENVDFDDTLVQLHDNKITVYMQDNFK